VLQAKLQHRNDKVTPAAKLIVISAWIDGLFQFGPREFDRAIAYTFAIEQKLFDQAMKLAESHGWIEFDRTNEVVMELTLLETIFCPKEDSSQRRLDLGSSHADLATDEIAIHLGSLRRLLPRKVMGHPSLHFAHKLLFIVERVENGLMSETMHFPFSKIGKTVGLDRNSVRAGAEALARFTGSCALAETGSIAFPLPIRLYSRTEIELFERVHRLTFRGDRIASEFLKSVDEEGSSSTAALTSGGPSSTVALTNGGSREQQALMNGGVRQRSENQTVDGSIVSSTVRSQALTTTPLHERNRSREAPLVNAPTASVPHNYDYDMNNMLCGQSNEEDQGSRVLAREQLILSFCDRIDLTETLRYWVRVWALIGEPDLVTNARGDSLTLDDDKLLAILNTVAPKKKHGGYVTVCITEALGLAKSDQPRWRDAAEMASRAIGIPFGREMRDEVVGGLKPAWATTLIEKPSRAPRGGDQLDDSEKHRDALILRYIREGISKPDAVAKADRELRGQPS
jgi:hypothetical protein